MRCPSCAQENPGTARFCGGCGQGLESTCPACRASNPPANRFCHQCGASLAPAAPVSAAPFASPQTYTPKHLAEKILSSRSVLEGERKQVTVLFVDISGFTSLSARLDPEEVHGLMRRAFELMLAEVHRYEGTVNQFLGDGLMALFGAPIAHEDHARRAIQAALGIRDALAAYHEELGRQGIAFRARQGLNTGLVVVGSIGSDLRMDYTAVGDTTNVAARLQQAAEPDTVLISQATHRLVSGYVETRELPPLHLKGKDEAVRAWEVLSARETRTRLEVEADRGLTPLVGRDRELAVLLESFEKARAGHGQVVLIVGEAGIGKSRLLLEFRRRLGDAADWLEGHCVSFGRSMALHPLVDLLRRGFGIDDADTERRIVEKIQHRVARLGDDLRPITPYLLALLSVDPGDPGVRGMSPQERRGETLDALRRWLARAAETRPQVVVIEDLHWSDSATEEFLGALVDSVPALPAVLVFTYRPGYVNPFADRSYVTRLVPSPLSAEHSRAIAQAVLATEDLPGELRHLVGEKAEGNPFYVEELVKSLAESGALRRVDGRYELARPVADTSVPGTIQDVIAARIDRLDEAPKRTLQIAAVIGREFTQRLVHRLSDLRDRTDQLLRELLAIELIRERRLFPELAYMFKHALTQDVAYHSLLVQRRKDLHHVIGRAIEELYGDRLAEHYEVLAHHFSRAEDWERALPYLSKAAQKAAQAYGLREALALYQEALAVAARLGDRAPRETIMDVRRARADLLRGIGEYGPAAEEARALVTLAREAGDRQREAAGLAQQADSTAWMEDFPAALALAAEAVAVGEAAAAPDAVASALYVQGTVHAVTADHEAAAEEFGRSLALARAAQDVTRQGMALHFLGVVENWRGAYGRARQLATEGVGLVQERRLVVPLLRCRWVQGIACAGMGDYQAALEALEDGLALSERISDPAFLARFLNTLGWLHIECGDLEPGLALSARGLELARRSPHATGLERVAFTRTNEGDAHLARGDVAAAADALGEAHHIARNPPPSQWMTWRYATHCLASLGELALARGDPSAAAAFADQSLEIAVPTRSRKYEGRAWRIKGEAAAARRAWDDAEPSLRRALDIAREIGEPRSQWHALAALGRWAAARGRADAARPAYRAAGEVVDAVVARVGDAGLRAGLEQSPVIREIRDATRRG